MGLRVLAGVAENGKKGGARGRSHTGRDLRHASSPEVLEPLGRQLGVAHGVLDISVAEIGLQRPRIVALAGQREAAGVAQHVRVNLQAQPGGITGAAQKPRKAGCGERRAAF